MRLTYVVLCSVYFLLAVDINNASAQYEDKRCRCICTNPATSFNRSSTDRQVFTGNYSLDKCSCDGSLLKKVGIDVKDQEHTFCLRCECKFETRNTKLIMVAVFMIICTLIMLGGYIYFMVCLLPIMNRDRVKPYNISYRPAEVRNLLLVGNDVDD